MSQDTRRGLKFSGDLRRQTSNKGWDHRTSLVDRFQPTTHDIDNVSEIISTPSNDKMRTSSIVSPASNSFTETEFSNEEAVVVVIASRDSFILQKPKAVTIPRSRSITPQIHETQFSEESLRSEVTLRFEEPPRKRMTVLGPKRRSTSENLVDLLSRWSNVISGVIYFIIPLLLIAFAIRLAFLDGKDTDSNLNWSAYQNLMQVASTLFPFTFALLIGRAVKKSAAYLLEHGTTLEKLEQLMGSRSLFSTITTQIHLRSANALTFSLITLWILSPIGSQGFLRLVYPSTNSKTTSILTMNYFTTDAQSKFAAGNTISSDPVQSDILNSMYAAAVYGPSAIKSGPMDLWMNVKIPYLSSLTSVTGPDWVTISPIDTVTYSSLVGIPIAGLLEGDTNLNIESSYTELSCLQMTKQASFTSLTSFALNNDSNNFPFALNNETYYGSGTTVLSANPISNAPITTATWLLGLNGFISPSYNSSLSNLNSSKSCQPNSAPGYIASPCYLANLSLEQVTNSTLLFQSSINNALAPEIATTTCIPTQVYVESKISCSSAPPTTSSCRVTAIRHSQINHAPPPLTPLSFPEIFQAISQQLPQVFHTQLDSTVPDPSLLFLNNPLTIDMLTTDNMDITTVNTEALERRLGQLINTYYLLSQAYTLITLGGPVALVDNPGAVATITHLSSTYQVSWIWFAVLITGSLVMLLAAVLGSLLEQRITTPEVMGTVTGAIRDSRYLYLRNREGDSGADGFALARANKGVRLKMGGIGDGSEERGYLTILRAEGDREG